MKTTTQPTVLFLFFFCLYLNAQAQTFIPETRLYDLKDGLSHRQINDILEDKRGFIWIATPSGLNRFDGYTFRVFGREDGLHSDQVNNIFEDAYGLIWVYYAPGVDAFDVLDPLSNKVFSFTEKYGDKILDGYKNKVGKPVLDKDSTLYWATHKGFISYHPKRGFHSVTIASPLLSDSNAIFSLNFISEQKTFWGFVTKTGGANGDHNILELDKNGIVLQNIEYKSSQLMYVNSGTTVGSTHFYNTIDSRGATCTRISSDNKITTIPSTQFIPAFNYFPEINAYFPFYDQNLIYSDLKVFDKAGKNILFDFGKAHPEFNKKARGVLLDHTGKIWITTDFGLILVNFHQSRFKRFLFNPDVSKKGISCRGILEKDNQLLVCTEGAIFIGDKTTGVFQKYPNTFQSEKAIKASYWYSLTSDKAGRILAGSESDVKLLTPNPSLTVAALPNINVLVPWTIYPDNQQHFWLGSERSGLFVYDLAAQQLRPFTQYNGFDELKSTKIISIQADHTGQVWVCAVTGFYKLDLERGILERHWTGGKGNMHLPYDNILHFYEDKDGIFWFGTGGGGLVRWDKKNGTTQQFSRKAGLPNNTIYAVYEDEHEHLWLPSDYGIIQFDKKRGQVRRVYLPEDGITNPEFNSISHYRGADGTLYFGGMNGVTAFNPNDFYEKEGATHIPLVITNFQQFDGDSNKLKDKTGDLLSKNEITLNPDDRFFNLEFALLSFNQSDKIQYAHKIDGIDTDWNYQNEPRLRISRLPYGTHILHIRGQAANGLWGSNELTIKIHVLRPFYLQIWFILLSLAALAFLAWSLFRWRTKDLVQNQQRLETEVAMQTKELRQLDSFKTRLYTNITHEFRTPLTVIMGMVDNIRGFATERELIKRNSKNLLRLINQLLDLSKLESGTLKAQNIQGDIMTYLQYLTESFYSMAKEKNINLAFYAETKTLVMDFDDAKIQHIVYNLLSNALKFTDEDGKVIMHAVQIEKENQPFLKLKVQDTGVGIAAEEMPFIFDRFYQAQSSNTHKSGGTGVGLALTKEMVEWMNGTIEVESAVGKGTSFTVLLPVKRENDEGNMVINKENFIENVEIVNYTEGGVGETILEKETEKPILLIIEDNRDVVFYMQSILQDSYTIYVAKNGKIGVDLAFDLIPDIIISDVMMPEMDGYEVCEKLKTDERTSHIPIILLTAKSTVDDKITGLKLGADAYLMKPFNKEELFVRLEKLLELRRVLQKRNTQFETPPSVKTDKIQASKLSKPSGRFETSPRVAAEEKTAPTLDDIFLQKIQKVIEDNLNNTELGIEQLGKAVHLGHTQLFRKMKAITGLSPTLYIRKIRLQKAVALLKTTEMNISEIAYDTGFSDPNYFSRVFSDEMGVPPSSMRK